MGTAILPGFIGNLMAISESMGDILIARYLPEWQISASRAGHREKLPKISTAVNRTGFR